jgi:hypothetical protein
MDIYKISIALAMTSNHNAILPALAAQLLGVHTNVNNLTGGFGKLKVAIAGALAIGAGFTLLDTMVKLVDKTKEYSDELAKLETLGGGMAKAVVSGEISRKAFDISQRVPMKVEDLMKIPGASYSILGQEDSMAVWEKLAQFQWVIQNQKGFKGDAGDDMAKFLRAGELGGRLTDPNTHKASVAELTKFLDLAQRVMAATHGMVTPSTLLGMSQQAGFSMRGMTDEGFINMAIMAQAMGGPRAGTAMLSTYQQMGGGKMTVQAATNMQDMGLLNAGEWHTDHGKVIVNPEVQRRLGALLAHNPMDLVDQILKNLEARGITDPTEQSRLVMGALSRQTGQRFVNEQIMNHEQMAAERERMGQGAGSAAAAGIYGDKSITANEEALANAWHNLQVAVAGPQSENVIMVLKELTGVMNAMQLSVTGMSPNTIKLVAEGIAALSIALVGVGTVALVALAGIPGIIIGIGLAAAALIAIEWQSIKTIFDSIKNAISGFIDWLATIPGRIIGMFTGGTGKGATTTDEFGRVIPQSFEGKGPDKDNPYRKAAFGLDSGGAQHSQYSFALNVDGDRLAQTVIDKIEAKYGFPTGAAGADTLHHWVSGDHGGIGA